VKFWEKKKCRSRFAERQNGQEWTGRIRIRVSKSKRGIFQKWGGSSFAKQITKRSFVSNFL